MTDITDRDLRLARQWAEGISSSRILNENASAAARVILATVDAPEPTLTEDILDAAARIRDAVNPGDRDVSWADMESCATRAEQMEYARNTLEQQRDYWRDSERQAVTERDEARAEVDRLTAEREQAQSDLAEVTNARDSLREEFDHARVEVERLTAANEELRKTDNYRQFREQFLTVQKGAESNAETPDPADVKPGEAWIVECHGERRTAVKDRDDDEPWNTFTAGGLFFPEDNEAITLVSRLVPAPRVITNPDELDTLPVCTILRDEDGAAWHRTNDQWTTTAEYSTFTSRAVLCSGPVTVLWEPGA